MLWPCSYQCGCASTQEGNKAENDVASTCENSPICNNRFWVLISNVFVALRKKGGRSAHPIISKNRRLRMTVVRLESQRLQVSKHSLKQKKLKSLLRVVVQSFFLMDFRGVELAVVTERVNIVLIKGCLVKD